MSLMSAIQMLEQKRLSKASTQSLTFSFCDFLTRIDSTLFVLKQTKKTWSDLLL